MTLIYLILTLFCMIKLNMVLNIQKEHGAY